MEDMLYYNDYNCCDDGQGIITWQLETSANWLDIDPKTGELSGTPTNDNRGNVWVEVSVSDGNGGVDRSGFYIRVLDANDPPTIITEDNVTVFEDDFYLVDYNATDIDGDIFFKWNLVTNVPWLNIDNDTGILSGTPENDDVGFSFVNITVRDERGGNSSQNFTLEVINVNDPPQRVVLPDETNYVKEYDTFIFDVNATDIDIGDVLSYNINSEPKTDITIDPETGIIKWTASIKDLDEYNILKVILSVNDNKDPIFHYFDIIVIPNPQPTVKLVSPTHNELVSTTGVELKWEGYDQKNEPLTYDIYISRDQSTVSDKLESARVIQNTNVTSYSIQDLDVGRLYYWTVILYDGFSYGNCLDGISIFVVNTPPTLLPIPDQTVTVGTEFMLEVKGSDFNEEDIGKLVYGLNSAPKGMIIDPSTGLLSWMPTEEQVRTHTVEVLVSDGKDVTTTMFAIEVTKITPEKEALSDNQSSFVNYIILIIIVVIILSILLVILKRRKRSLSPDVEYIPPQDKRGIFLPGQTAKPGAISAPSVIIDQVAPASTSQQTQIQPSSVPGQIPSIPTPTIAQQPQLPPALLDTHLPEQDLDLPAPEADIMPSPMPTPISEPIPVTISETEPLEPFLPSELDEVPEVGLENGPEPVQREGVEYDMVAERVVEETDYESATANLRTAAVVEPTRETSVVHEGDTNIWQPDVRGKVAENKEVLEQLKTLAELKSAGVLTDAEFERKKRELLG